MSRKHKSPWGKEEKLAWLDSQSIQRHYADEVCSVIDLLRPHTIVKQYGALSIDPEKYPLYLVKTSDNLENKKNILITGGVHGYETSGVHGALGCIKRMLESEKSTFADRFNIVVAPCVSPWGYETINRWNADAIDPNRSFRKDSPAEESRLLMQAIDSLNCEWLAHFDLHETTDTDNTIFRPALAARDGVKQDKWDIPDGFYLVGDCEKPQDDFQSAIIQAVEKVTHIAPPDNGRRIIGEKITQKGVINYATKKLGLCAGMTDAPFVTTTEVYPDSANATPQECIEAQVAAVVGGLGYLMQHTQR